ncbi:hypothetical protein pb186bvf_002771 [Paramecium bursaria]
MGCGQSKRPKQTDSKLMSVREEYNEHNRITAFELKFDQDVNLFNDREQIQDIKIYDFNILIHNRRQPLDCLKDQLAGLTLEQNKQEIKKKRNLKLNLEEKVPQKSILKSSPSSGNRSGSSQNRKVEFSAQLFKVPYEDWTQAQFFDFIFNLLYQNTIYPTKKKQMIIIKIELLMINTLLVLLEQTYQH